MQILRDQFSDQEAQEKAFFIINALNKRDVETTKKIVHFLIDLSSASSSISSFSKRKVQSYSLENEKRTQLFKDFITGLQGIEGHYLKEARMNFLHEDERCILSFALKVGKLFSTIRKRANKLVSNFDAGLCNQRFAHAILDELQGYSHFLVLLEWFVCF